MFGPHGLPTSTPIVKKNIKMNVRLAVQTLSTSVGNTLQYLQQRNTSFENCLPTSEFCLIINQLFDILNVRSKFDRLVLDDSTKENIQSKFDSMTKYLKSLSLRIQRKVKQFDTDDSDTNDFENEELVDDPDPLGLEMESKISCTYIEEIDQLLLRSG